MRSSKVVITIVCLSVLLLTSLFGNVQQFIVNSRMMDNDLKYRYIKSTNGITPENLYKLEAIFHVNPDKKLIREIQQKVTNWEKTIQNTAEKLEHEKLRNSKSKKMIVNGPLAIRGTPYDCILPGRLLTAKWFL